MKIKVLDEIIANTIAAGEVIERPASVVKELVENALDASARRIEVFVVDCGRKLIEVRDDGEGMEQADALTAFTRHATSKISTRPDLFNIKTLGFRGEALPSIASVSLLSMVTATADGSATQVDINGGRIESVKTAVRQQGTTIKVQQLFFNTPARFKFMKSDQTETSNIIETMTLAALSRPDVMMQLTINEKETLRTPGTGQLSDTLDALWGSSLTRNVVYLEAKNDDFQVSGYFSGPALTRTNRYQMHIFVNRRPVRMYQLQNRIVDSYGDNLARGRYPVVVLNIELDPYLVDVNVHPTKREIKMANERDLLDLVGDMVASHFKTSLMPSSFTPPPRPLFTPDTVRSFAPVDNQVPVVAHVSESVVNEIEATPNIETLNPPQVPTIDPLEPADFPQPHPLSHNYQIIGQIKLTYIAFQDEYGLTLVDQHAAMERINYEKLLLAMAEPGTIAPLFPYLLNLTPAEAILFEPHRSELLALGFDFANFGPHSYRLISHPTWMIDLNEDEVIGQLVALVLAQGPVEARTLRREQIALAACKSSLKANQKLSLLEMEALLEQLLSCKFPSTCPHGRPIMLHYPFKEIEKGFKRSGF